MNRGVDFIEAYTPKGSKSSRAFSTAFLATETPAPDAKRLQNSTKAPLNTWRGQALNEQRARMPSIPAWHQSREF